MEIEDFETQHEGWTEYVEPRPVEQFNPKDQELIKHIDEALAEVAISEALRMPVPGRWRHPNRNLHKP